ncbi:hypothetical protein ACQW5G_00725 [Fructilactobacillus sp. Tb1]|uniref:hypothetical protein n=1 Tax=Fructilactobacillus sp. Tb1 TaxID=3422304 RepID=UPI003D2BD9D3
MLIFLEKIATIVGIVATGIIATVTVIKYSSHIKFNATVAKPMTYYNKFPYRSKNQKIMLIVLAALIFFTMSLPFALIAAESINQLNLIRFVLSIVLFMLSIGLSTFLLLTIDPIRWFTSFKYFNKKDGKTKKYYIVGQNKNTDYLVVMDRNNLVSSSTERSFNIVPKSEIKYFTDMRTEKIQLTTPLINILFNKTKKKTIKEINEVSPIIKKSLNNAKDKTIEEVNRLKPVVKRNLKSAKKKTIKGINTVSPIAKKKLTEAKNVTTDKSHKMIPILKEKIINLKNKIIKFFKLVNHKLKEFFHNLFNHKKNK